ncbi:hypothetical protein L1987_12856 [Smallanthus sonchifolius]|uniref:Uncharacterized protein n=1 Tax=Smallanthus sonchifolius TaxID=185202 RepID=A0ACB9JFS7_9ASTR|nr:hypothetical protein L1987_12856 [Smallanthus sonchifolius]
MNYKICSFFLNSGLGGLLGNDAATGRGVLFATEALLNDHVKGMAFANGKTTICIQERKPCINYIHRINKNHALNTCTRRISQPYFRMQTRTIREHLRLTSFNKHLMTYVTGHACLSHIGDVEKVEKKPVSRGVFCFIQGKFFINIHLNFQID